jgi:hypothetical protein
MTVEELLEKIDNGACHILLINNDNGQVILKTIWHNDIEEQYLKMNVKHICVKDYELRLMVE